MLRFMIAVVIVTAIAFVTMMVATYISVKKDDENKDELY